MSNNAILKKTISFLTHDFNVFEIKGIEYIELKNLTEMLDLNFEHELIEALDTYGEVVYGTLQADIETTELSLVSSTLIRLDRAEFFIGRNSPKALPRPLTTELVGEMTLFHRNWRYFIRCETAKEIAYDNNLRDSYKQIGIISQDKGG